MTTETWPTKDPDEVFDYVWVIELDEGDGIVSSSFVLVAGSVVIDSNEQTETGRAVVLSGGTSGEINQFLGMATTTLGRTYDITIYLPVVSSDADADFMGQFLTAFPSFAAVGVPTIALWKAQAELITSGLADCLGDRADMATMLLTAHYLTLAGVGTGAESEMAAQGMAGFKSIKSGTLSLDRGEVSTKGGEFAATSYGARAWAMIAPCLAGPRVTGTGYVVGGCGFNGWAGPLPGYYR